MEMSAKDKVKTIFKELVGNRNEQLDGRYLGEVRSRVTAALASQEDSESIFSNPEQISFHLIDWHTETAFLVALELYPERFTDEEIQEGVEAFLIHAPSHVVEAARLAGFACDTFSPEQGSE